MTSASIVGTQLMISLLIENGVDPLAKSNAGHTALEVLKASRQTWIVHEESDIAKRFQLSQSILEKRELNDHIINKKAINRSHLLEMPGLASGLVFYGLKNDLEELYYLNPNAIDESDDRGWTPLHEAVRNGNIEIFKFLIEKGVNVCKKTNDGDTAMDIAKKFAKDVEREINEEIASILKIQIEESKPLFSNYLRWKL